MQDLQRASILLALNQELRKAGSWAGETHMQKATYFLQELLRVPLGFEFILYKHGPFSFDLRDELTAMRAHGFLRLEPQYPYGPSLLPGEKSEMLQQEHQKAIEGYRPVIDFVSQKLGNKDVAGLERIATALYVTLDGSVPSADRARKITELKPHISSAEAAAAVAEIAGVVEEAPILPG